MPREALFDLAVNRAATYAIRLGLLGRGAEALPGLEPWYLKTRFAYRVPLADVLAALATIPPDADPARVRWRGGPAGGWSTDSP